MASRKPQIKVRQSLLKQWLLCPEQLRSVMAGEVDDVGSDAALTGTAGHAYIEDRLKGSAPDEAIATALGVLRAGWDDVRHVKTQKLATAEGHVLNVCSTWEQQIYPQMGQPLYIEHHFEIPVADEGDYEVVLSGTVDVVDDAWGLCDWKTAGSLRKYQDGFGNEGWQLRRWDVQSSIYTYAMSVLTGQRYNEFTFVAMHRTQPEVAVLTVQRDESHWSFVIEQARRLAAAIWAGVQSTAPWQMNNQHALCSEDWCPNWHRCVGAHTLVAIS
jgi:hypothetical protein